MAGVIEAEIDYYAPEVRPPAGSRPDFLTLPIKPAQVKLSDIRESTDIAFAESGFALRRHPTKVKNFKDLEETNKVYVPEIQGFLQDFLGCSELFCYSPMGLRSSAPEGQRGAGLQQTGSFAHADVDPWGAETFVRKTFPEGEAEERLKRRFAFYNVWRPISAPPHDVPLALCDARSVAREDKQACKIDLPLGGGATFSWGNYAYIHNPGHRWFYCSDMTPDDLFIFRTYDNQPGDLEPVPHSAFVDPNCPKDVPNRESAEIRFVAFFE